MSSNTQHTENKHKKMLGKKTHWPNHTEKKLLRASFILSQNAKYLHTKCMCKHHLNCTGTIFLVGSFVRSVVVVFSYRFDSIQSGSVGVFHSQFCICNASGILPGLVFQCIYLSNILFKFIFGVTRFYCVARTKTTNTHQYMRLAHQKYHSK